jgi:hypothetical protein
MKKLLVFVGIPVVEYTTHQVSALMVAVSTAQEARRWNGL